ncbi:MAG: electron transfer flavoprotein subunit beta, partial [Candidatus Eremiobacteraeota bacterium]|nr:electron transfer flavoprotein subunit beta [Candidatus Eremiobacteraeota bacterium]
MKIVVTMKLVPDPNAEKKIDPQSKRLVRTGVETVLNPYDEYALEAGLQLKERVGGDTRVTIFSMAPENLKETLRRA